MRSVRKFYWAGSSAGTGVFKMVIYAFLQRKKIAKALKEADSYFKK